MTYSCRLAGLPAPVEVVARQEPWWTGSFAAWGKTGSPLCFPPDCRFARGRLPRFHIWLRFPRPITGPLSLGRLRFQGYGVFWSLPAEMPVISGRERLELRFGRGAQPPQLVVQQL
jgi:CRISPR-associated protein Csb2